MPKRSSASTTTATSKKKQKKAAATAKTPPAATASSNSNSGDLPVSSWRVVLTGEFVLKPKAVLEDALKQKGVAITTAISGKTTHLLLGNKSGVNEYGKKTGIGSSKHNDALARQLPILSEETVWARLGDAGVAEAAIKPVTKRNILEITTKPPKKAPLIQKVMYAFQEAEGSGTDTLVREPVEQYFSKWKYCPEEGMDNPVGLTLVKQGGGIYIGEISPTSMFANEPNFLLGMRIKRIGNQGNIRSVDQAYQLLRQAVYDNRLVRITALPTSTKTTFVVSLPKLKKELTEQFDINFDNTRSKNALKKALTTLVEEQGTLVKQSGTSYALVVETETRPPLALTPREEQISRQAKIDKLYPEQGRWKGLREVSRTKSKSGRATCRACGQLIAKGEMQVQVANSSLLKMLGNDFDRPYTEEDFGLGRTIAVQKFNIHSTCLEAANTQCRDLFQQEWKQIRPQVLESRQEELD